MKYFIPFIIFLSACSDDKRSDDNSHLRPGFKITIASDTICDGTKYQYILTNVSYSHIYLAAGPIANDTIVDEQPIVNNDRLKEILESDLDKLKSSDSIYDCWPIFIISVNGRTRSIAIDKNNPQDIVCKTVAYINTLATEKYKLHLCDVNKVQSSH